MNDGALPQKTTSWQQIENSDTYVVFYEQVESLIGAMMAQLSAMAKLESEWSDDNESTTTENTADISDKKHADARKVAIDSAVSKTANRIIYAAPSVADAENTTADSPVKEHTNKQEVAIDGAVSESADHINSNKEAVDEPLDLLDEFKNHEEIETRFEEITNLQNNGVHLKITSHKDMQPRLPSGLKSALAAWEPKAKKVMSETQQDEENDIAHDVLSLQRKVKELEWALEMANNRFFELERKTREIADKIRYLEDGQKDAAKDTQKLAELRRGREKLLE